MNESLPYDRKKLWRDQNNLLARLPKLKKLYQEKRYLERALEKDPENAGLIASLVDINGKFNIYLQDTNTRYQNIMQQHRLSCEINKKEYDDPFRKVNLDSWKVEPPME